MLRAQFNLAVQNKPCQSTTLGVKVVFRPSSQRHHVDNPLSQSRELLVPGIAEKQTKLDEGRLINVTYAI